ncbi:hypothetical protein MA9V1_261 [Chryseobacterium phage MA9V-1]|nr:hypothetical protein MA9V1_261 [Chryseobacterium phage MA9V-1]
MLIKPNDLVKQAFHKRTNIASDYLTNLRDTNIYVSLVALANDKCREHENVSWHCAFCIGEMTINCSDFSALKFEDFLCDKCVEIPKSDALCMNVIKSSNNLFINLQNRIRHNFKGTELPTISVKRTYR